MKVTLFLNENLFLYHKIRNTKSETMTQMKIDQTFVLTDIAFGAFRHLDFEFVSNFNIRNFPEEVMASIMEPILNKQELHIANADRPVAFYDL